MADGLLNKASIILTPTGYKAGTLYNVAPVVEPYEDFDFVRASVASRVNSSGLVEMVGRTLGSELITNGDFATDSDWTKGAGWSIADGVATSDGTQSANSDLTQNLATETGKQYQITYTISNYSGTGNIFVRINSGNTTTAQSGNGTFTEVLTGAGGTQFIFRADADFIGTIDNVSVKEIIDTNNIPRINYDSNGDNGHILLEPTSTNLIPYSEDFTQWSKEASVTLTSNYGISPDGTQNSTRMQMNADDSLYISTSSGLTASFYVKGTLGETIRLSNGSAITHTLTGNWDRVETYDSSSASSLISINTYSGATARDIEIWGAQAEALSYATSYIPTLTGSQEVRATETATGAGSADLINSTEGVLYAEIAALANSVDFRMISISDGSNNNRVRINYTATNQQIQSRVVVGGVTQAEINKFGFSNITDFTKIALLYKENEVKLYINGTLIGTDTSASMPSANTFDTLNFNGSISNSFYGKCKALAVFKEALSDSELTQLTT